jgi:hypothetical protein
MKSSVNPLRSARLAVVLASVALAVSVSGALAGEKPVKAKKAPKAKSVEMRTVTGSNIPVPVKDGKAVSPTLTVRTLDSNWMDKQGQGRLIETLVRVPGMGRGL